MKQNVSVAWYPRVVSLVVSVLGALGMALLGRWVQPRSDVLSLWIVLRWIITLWSYSMAVIVLLAGARIASGKDG